MPTGQQQLFFFFFFENQALGYSALQTDPHHHPQIITTLQTA